jgi:hypothetical protein
MVLNVEEGGPVADARTVQQQHGSVTRPASGQSNPKVATIERALAYLQKAVGLGQTPTPVEGGFQAARLPGHYAIFVGEEHVVYGRVFAGGGRQVIVDAAIARGWSSIGAYKTYLSQFQGIYGQNPTIRAYRLGPVRGGK